jgi:Tfp pilus assembly protein PilO
MRLSPRDQIIVAAVLIVLVAAAFIIFAILPQFRSLDDLEEQERAAEQEIAAAQTLLSRRLEAKEAAADTQAELMALSSQIPQASELPSLIIELQDAANEAELDFLTIAPTSPQGAGGGLTAIDVNMTLRGSWEQLMDFMDIIADLTRETRVVSVSANAQEGEDILDEDGNIVEEVDERYLNASVLVRAYMMPAAVAAPADAPPPGENGG